ncbi:MAG: MarR family transcriptional regulator [Bacillaceae bacterium]|uniref:MarR family transcriptional regulator n=1 Tax=Alkalihalobacterium chitinilyticum TaxID=2980103 RepID=A0ABT5VJZ7_9BACI|nr:MarR family transcriptional regulator [Alkalihalobacterium chitinilyticum]MDE5415531.1 MarR family transcriptional regulator [Alkalihalobacterium chitinilyticum]MEB1809348.1 MarR family transcriptional regulator [Bacillaceae bacterium]
MTNDKKQNEELALKSFIVLSRAHRAVSDRVEEDIRRYGLNPTEFAVLELLFHKGDQAIQQIGKKVLLASGSITYVVDKLEKKNLIIRRACPKDRRVTYAAITEEGNELMRKIFPSHQEAIEKIFSSLDQGERETLIELLKKLGINA